MKKVSVFLIGIILTITIFTGVAQKMTLHNDFRKSIAEDIPNAWSIIVKYVS